MAFIFAASSVPGTQLPGRFWDKLVHFVVYALLGVLFMLPLSGGRLDGVTRRSAVAALVLSMLYGVSDELHQTFTPNRTADAMDVVADTLGASAGILFVVVSRMLWRVKLPRA
jgi:VanZ family protein